MTDQPVPTSDLPKLLRVLKGERLDPPPIWLMRQAGRYLPEYREVRARAGGFVDLCLNPGLATEVTLQPIRRYGFDAAILFSDILMVPYGLERGLAFKEGEGPVLDPIRDEAALPTWNPSQFHARLAPVYETVSLLRHALPRDVTLIGFAGAPWTVASYMVEGGSSRDFIEVKSWAYRDPGGFGRLIDLLVAVTADYLLEQVRAGAQVLQIFDSWAGVLPEADARRWVIEPTRRLVAVIRETLPDIPIIGFPRGLGLLIPEYVRETGVDSVSLDTTVPSLWADRELPPGLPVQGQLDPIYLLGDPRIMGGEALRLVDAWRGRPHIFNLGHGILPQTDPDAVARLVTTLRAGHI